MRNSWQIVLMRFSTFYEFHDKEKLESIKSLPHITGLYTGLEPTRTIPKEDLQILRTNAKLFYEKSEEEHVDMVIELIEKLGFVFVCRYLEDRVIFKMIELFFAVKLVPETKECPHIVYISNNENQAISMASCKSYISSGVRWCIQVIQISEERARPWQEAIRRNGYCYTSNDTKWRPINFTCDSKLTFTSCSGKAAMQTQSDDRSKIPEDQLEYMRLALLRHLSSEGGTWQKSFYTHGREYAAEIGVEWASCSNYEKNDLTRIGVAYRDFSSVYSNLSSLSKRVDERRDMEHPVPVIYRKRTDWIPQSAQEFANLAQLP